MEQKIAIIQAYIDAYNKFDIEAMIQNLDSDIIFENYASKGLTHKTQGIQEFKMQAKKAATLFESRTQQITDITKNENEIIVAIKYQGILASDISDELKKGEEIKLEGKSIFSFQNQKISKIVDKS